MLFLLVAHGPLSILEREGHLEVVANLEWVMADASPDFACPIEAHAAFADRTGECDFAVNAHDAERFATDAGFDLGDELVSFGTVARAHAHARADTEPAGAGNA